MVFVSGFLILIVVFFISLVVVGIIVVASAANQSNQGRHQNLNQYHQVPTNSQTNNSHQNYNRPNRKRQVCSSCGAKVKRNNSTCSQCGVPII